MRRLQMVVAALVAVLATVVCVPLVAAAAGDVESWGRNDKSQLGDGTTANRSDAVAAGIGQTTDIAGGRHHVVALRSNGTVATWGWNAQGQLGDNTQTNRATPITVSGIENATAVGAGHYHSLAVSDGQVFAWGRNKEAQLGQADLVNRSAPTAVAGVSSAVQVAAGREHSLALLQDGTVVSWGNNNDWQLGDGTTQQSAVGRPVAGLSNVNRIIAGRIHSIALRSDGTVWTWGDNEYGQLGDGTAVDRNQPVQVAGLTNITDIVAFGFHTVAIDTNGTVWSWGRNNYGQLGDGTTELSGLPVQVLLPPVTAIGSGRDYAMAAQADGTIWAWGRNDSGQLGDNTSIDRPVPLVVDTVIGATELVGGRDYVAVRVGGALPPDPEPTLECSASAVGADLRLSWTEGLGRAVIRKDGSWLSTPGKVSTTTVSGAALTNDSYVVRLRIDGVRTDIPCLRDNPPAGPSCTAVIEGGSQVLSWSDGLGRVNVRRNGSWYATIEDQTTTTVTGSADVFSIRVRPNGTTVELPCDVA